MMELEKWKWEIMEIYEIYRNRLNVRSGGSLHSPRNLEIVLLE